MKKIILFLFTLIPALSVSAQKKALPISVKAGVTFPKITASKDAIAFDGGAISESSVNTSFYFGATVDIPLGKNIAFQPGFSIVGKGTEASYFSYNTASAKINLLYFEIPANAIAYIPVGKQKIFFGLGPYLGVALSGTARYKYVINDDVVRPDKQNVKFGSDRDFKRLDFGGNALAGFQLANGLNIQAGISASAVKFSNSRDVYLNAKNLVYSVGLGFTL
ncbi:porin family protein [Pedobacter sp. UBA5917]|jgi:hypothetical protein|uniref:porin family protein n=1 Tax=Pedobacter sp. UBA5917 TaxID=1947061 RepID=UPI0025D39C8D|nr:porin family protein [Pedobacter sp. UBA5917]